MIAIEIDSGIGTGAAGPHQSMDSAARLPQQPESVAADVVHVRVDGHDGGRHGDHGLQGIAAFGQDRTSSLGGGMMGSGGDAAAMSGCVEVHVSAGPATSSR
jgi:hypothetical protein